MTSLQDVHTSIPNLRNGNADNYEVVHIASGIDDKYNFLPFVANHAPRDSILRAIHIEAAMYANKLEGGDIDEDKARKLGVCLAACRIGAESAWTLGAGDLINTQTHPNTTYTDAYNHANIADFGTNLPSVLIDTDVHDHYQGIIADNAFLDAGTMASLMKMGMACPIINGIVLVKTEHTHHFTREHRSIFLRVYNQIYGRDSQPPFGLSFDDFEDITAHKTCHPIVSARMVAWARHAETKNRLRAAGLGAASVGLPAMYPSQSSASALLTLMHKVKSIAKSANVALAADDLITRLEEITASQMADNAARTATADTMSTIANTHGSDIAVSIGILRAVTDHAAIRHSPLLNSYYLKNIADSHAPEVATGVNQMESFFRVKREKARRGILSGIGLFGADVPADTEALPADETMSQILGAVLGNANNRRQVN